jgi:hypothetical protein
MLRLAGQDWMLVDQSAKFFLADPFCVRDHHLSRSEDGSAFVPLRVTGYVAKLGDKGIRADVPSVRK